MIYVIWATSVVGVKSNVGEIPVTKATWILAAFLVAGLASNYGATPVVRTILVFV